MQRRAKLRLLELVDPATAKLARILATTNDEKVALKTIEMIFDRTGMHARAGLDVEDSRALLVERLLELQPRDDDDVV